ncbi:hypothetical protein BC833DRAFT_567952 [Globomyces pollinis-pini]|nr:hypothetical protein BC833DRAFT_567952 [Globomyces pollinis-pini]
MEIENIPTEVLGYIISYLESPFQYMTVSKTWKEEIHKIKSLTLKTSKAKVEYGLMNIINQFPALKQLKLEGIDSKEMDITSRLVDDFASQFMGHATIIDIESVSDQVMNGVFNCPRLITLSLPIEQMGRIDDNEFQNNRNLGLIIQNLPQLTSLTLDSPVLMVESYNWTLSSLKTLTLTSVDRHSLYNLMTGFNSNMQLINLYQLTIDVAHHQISSQFIPALSKGCPNLKSLKFKFAILGDSVLNHICIYLPNLAQLRFSRCDIPFITKKWSLIFKYLACYLKNLHTIAFKYCNISLLGRMDDRIQLGMTSHLKLRNLKLFDIRDERPDIFTIYTFLCLFPNLICFRTDLDLQCFPIPDQYQDVVYQGLRHCKVLEFRFAKLFGDPIKACQLDIQPLVCTELQHLTVWGSKPFPDFLILPNAAHLTTLSLNFTTEPPDGVQYHLPSLKVLEIKAISHLAQDICLNCLVSLTVSSTKLESFALEAANRSPDFFDLEILSNFIHTCPRIRSFKTVQFQYDFKSLTKFLVVWPQLHTLMLCGQRAVGIISNEFEDTFLFPLLNTKPLLHTIRFGVTDVTVQPFESTHGIRTRQVDTSQYDFMFKVALHGMFRRYEDRIRQFYHQLRCVKIRGPLEDGYGSQTN